MESAAHKGLRVCVGLTQERDSQQTGPMFCEVLEGLGHKAWVAYPWDRSFLDADILLLSGSFYRFSEFGAALSRHTGKKPVTVLWQFDPLPPVSLSAEAEKIGLRLGGLDWGRMDKRNSRLIKKLVPFSSKACRLARWFLAQNLKREMVRNDPGRFENVDSSELFSIMAPYVWLKKHLNEGWIDHIVASTVPRLKFMNSRGIEARFIPVGYHYRWGQHLNLQRDIDVLYLGSLRGVHRRNILHTVQRELASRKIDLKIITRDCYGEERTKLLNRTRIVLDISRLPWDKGGMRFLMGMSCGALLISVATEDTMPYKPGVHFIQGQEIELADLICYYLRHDGEREKIVSSAYKFVTEELTLQNSILQILQGCNANTSVSTGCV